MNTIQLYFIFLFFYKSALFTSVALFAIHNPNLAEELFLNDDEQFFPKFKRTGLSADPAYL
jgi:hypothetical protein